MPRAQTAGWTQQHLPSGIRTLIDHIGEMLEQQTIPAPGIREGDGRFKVATIVEAAVMKFERDLRKTPGKVSPQRWDSFLVDYEAIRHNSNLTTPTVINTVLSEAAIDSVTKIAQWMRSNSVQAENAYYGDAVQKRRLVVYALLYTSQMKNIPRIVGVTPTVDDETD